VNASCSWHLHLFHGIRRFLTRRIFVAWRASFKAPSLHYLPLTSPTRTFPPRDEHDLFDHRSALRPPEQRFPAAAEPLAHRRGVEVGVRGVVCPSSSYSSSRRTDTYCAGVEEGDSPRTLYERLAINLLGGIPSFPHPFKTLLADQLNEKSSDTGRSLVEDAKAIVAAAGEDFKAGQKTLGETLGKTLGKAMVSSTRIICLTIMASVAGVTSSLSMEFKWALGASGLASAVYVEIRRAPSPPDDSRQMSTDDPPPPPCVRPSCIGSERLSTTSWLCSTSPLLLLRRRRWV